MSDDLGMSDEDFLNQAPPDFTDIPEEQPTVAPTDEADGEGDVSTEMDNQDDDEGVTDEGETDASTEEDEGSTETETEAATNDATSDDSDPIDYSEVLKPLSNSLEVKTVDEARQLMELGAKYAATQNVDTGNAQVIKMLENNGLLDEGKLNHLIDLSKNDPAAIAKLFKDAGLSAHDIDEEAEYVPKDYTVSAESVKLDQVLAEIKQTPSYERTLQVVGEQWDKASRAALSENPSLIAHINSHVASGIYDKVANEVTRQRVFGGLRGVSDYDAYAQVGKAMNDAQALQAAPATPVATTEKAKPQDTARSAKRKAASSPKTAPAKVAKKEESYLDADDEAFLKMIYPN